MYSARITRSNPTAFIFLIDQSGSMEEKMVSGGLTTTKTEVVTEVTNMMIRELIYRCRKEDGIADYFDIAAVGYSGSEASMLIGTKDSFVKPSTLANAACRKRRITRERPLPDGTTSIITDELKYWVEPKAEGNTPMRSVFEHALLLAGKWCRRSSHAVCYPPTIFNITDGEATDGDRDDLVEIANEIKSLGTDDGNVLIININISASFCDHTILFPCGKHELPGCRYADMLFEMSSDMPSAYNDSILHLKPSAMPPFRGMSLNASAADLIAMMNIGSLSVNKFL